MDSEFKIKAIIIDDEARHHETLSKMLTNFCPEIQLLGDAFNIEETIDLINEKNPQLIFLDIEMPGGNGFTLFDHFDDPPFESLILMGV